MNLFPRISTATSITASIAISLLFLFPINSQSATYALSPDGNAVVRLTPSSAISGASFDDTLVTSAYSGWTVNKASGGSIAINLYDAGWEGLTGGGHITATYTQSSSVLGSNTLNWIQVIDTNLPLNGAVSPYIDPVPNDDSLPFYWTTSEQAGYSTLKTVDFTDFSKRDPDSLTTTDPITWNAKLYAVEYDGNKSVTVHDGISWGWTMKPATIGSSVGMFNNPSPACPPAVCDGTGSSDFHWGEGFPGGGSPGSLSFSGEDFAPQVGDIFKLGTLTYHNGAIISGTEVSSVDLDIGLNFTNIPEENFVFHTSLSIVNTLNTSDPIASADHISFTEGGLPYTFNVLEGATASVDIMAKLTPHLLIAPAASHTAGKSLDEPDSSWYSYDLDLVSLANSTTGGFISVVPEPRSYALMLCGLLVIGCFSYHKTRWLL